MSNGGGQTATAAPVGEGFVGRYQLCFELASGGMAKVFLARIEGVAGFEKLVALKLIHRHLADQEDFVEMFLDEARIASRITHPNVCTVFDFGRAGSDYYLAMEFLMGEPLSRVMRAAVAEDDLVGSKRWTAILLRVMSDVCEGLHAAHELRNERGELLDVIHRDVSPHNLFVGYDGGVKIVDFGIASATDRLHTTQVGTVKGRHTYMAPEQALGKKLDRRADVWSVGVVLFESLAGKRLFKRSTEAATLAALVSDPIPRLSEVWPDVPPDVDAVIAKALSREPDERFATAREMGRAIERALMNMQQPAGKAEASELMEQLFVEEHAKRQGMVEQARTMRAGVVVPVSSDESQSAVQAVKHVEEPTAARPRRASRSLNVTALLAGIVGGVAITFFAAKALLGGETEPGASPATPSAAISPAEESPTETVQPGGALAGAGAEAEGEEREAEPFAAEPEPGSETASESGRAQTGQGGTAEAAEATGRATGIEPASDRVRAGAREREAETEDGDEDRARRSTRHRHRPQVASEPGTVSVVTPGGWADVFVDGSRVGRSPGRFQLPAGRHTIVLRPFGTGDPARVSVQVPSGGQARVSHRVTAP
jgi:serine/threonine-protein kinase